MNQDSRYQLILLGNKKPFERLLLKEFYYQTDELGLGRESINVISAESFDDHFHVKSPSIAIYFASEAQHYHEEILLKLKENSTLIIPVVTSDKNFSDQVPESLNTLTPVILGIKPDINVLVKTILEGFGLLRVARRLFISYQRNESSGVAIQLYEALEEAGFDVFLDTHSIRQEDHFQEELWHRFSDTDIAVILNTPKFLKNHWTPEEVARINLMGIGIVQLVWPEHKPNRESELMTPVFLSKKHFKQGTFNTKGSVLKIEVVKEFINTVESMRARSLASRRDTIITEFFSSAKKFNIHANLHAHKFITIKESKDVIIPSVGVPNAFTYNQSAELVKKIKKDGLNSVWVLYNNDLMQEKWLKHLSWLNEHLPVKSIKITEVEEWLKKKAKT